MNLEILKKSREYFGNVPFDFDVEPRTAYYLVRTPSIIVNKFGAANTRAMIDYEKNTALSFFYLIKPCEVFVPVSNLTYDGYYKFDALHENGRNGVIVFNNLYWFHYYLRKL